MSWTNLTIWGKSGEQTFWSFSIFDLLAFCLILFHWLLSASQHAFLRLGFLVILEAGRAVALCSPTVTLCSKSFVFYIQLTETKPRAGNQSDVKNARRGRSRDGFWNASSTLRNEDTLRWSRSFAYIPCLLRENVTSRKIMQISPDTQMCPTVFRKS